MVTRISDEPSEPHDGTTASDRAERTGRRSARAVPPYHRVRGEYREMPGLILTTQQAARLLGLEPDLCGHVLATLVAEEFLIRTRDGRYARRGACPKCD
jgi:hypothetical protein